MHQKRQKEGLLHVKMLGFLLFYSLGIEIRRISFKMVVYTKGDFIYEEL